MIPVIIYLSVGVLVFIFLAIAAESYGVKAVCMIIATLTLVVLLTGVPVNLNRGHSIERDLRSQGFPVHYNWMTDNPVVTFQRGDVSYSCEVDQRLGKWVIPDLAACDRSFTPPPTPQPAPLTPKDLDK